MKDEEGQQGRKRSKDAGGRSALNAKKERTIVFLRSSSVDRVEVGAGGSIARESWAEEEQ